MTSKLEYYANTERPEEAKTDTAEAKKVLCFVIYNLLVYQF